MAGVQLRSGVTSRDLECNVSVTPRSPNKDTPCTCNFPCQKQVYSPVVYPVLFRILTNSGPYNGNTASQQHAHSQWLPIGYRSNKTKLILSFETWSYKDRERVSLHNRIIGSCQFQTDLFSRSIKRPRSYFLSGDDYKHPFSRHEIPVPL